jgi:hypothetical protein
MHPTLRNLLLLTASVAPAYALWRLFDRAWSSAMLVDRVWPTYFGWFSSLSALQWLASAFVFFVLGAALARFFRGDRAVWWACGVGVACALLHLTLVTSWFAAHAEPSAFFWHYGELFVPPIAALLGAVTALRRWPPAGLNSSLKSRRSSSAA